MEACARAHRVVEPKPVTAHDANDLQQLVAGHELQERVAATARLQKAEAEVVASADRPTESAAAVREHRRKSEVRPTSE